MKSYMFRKQFLMHIGILILSFFVLLAALSSEFEEFFTEKQTDELVEQGKILSELIQKSYTLGIFFDYSEIEKEVQILNAYMDASFIYIDNNFTIKMYNSHIGDINGVILEAPELSPVMEGNIVSANIIIDGIIDEQSLIVAYPVYLRNSVNGAVLMISSVPDLQETIQETVRLVVLYMLLSIAIAFILIYFLARSVTKPVLAMNEVAKIIAQGDFDKRIEVKGKDEVSQLAESFNLMAESLSNQEKLRREFISNISHDFRSPLTSMRGFLEAIIDGIIPPEKQQKYVEIVLEETLRLSKLANDLLDINKVQALKLELCCGEFDINELIRKCVISFESRIVEKNIEFKIVLSDEKNLVWADYEKIMRVVHNLLDNGIRYAPIKGIVKIETTIIDKYVYVNVSDNGKGIAIENQSKIFERFYKEDISRGEEKYGSGLGLSIVQEFIKAHNESVSVRSEEGVGSEFSFRLPLMNVE